MARHTTNSRLEDLNNKIANIQQKHRRNITIKQDRVSFRMLTDNKMELSEADKNKAFTTYDQLKEYFAINQNDTVIILRECNTAGDVAYFRNH